MSGEREDIRRRADEAEQRLTNNTGSLADQILCLADAGFEMVARIAALETEVAELRVKVAKGPSIYGGIW